MISANADRRKPETGTISLERMTGLEPATYTLANVIVLYQLSYQHKQSPNHQPGADDRARTGDLHLGKVSLYQLSYIRRAAHHSKQPT